MLCKVASLCFTITLTAITGSPTMADQISRAIRYHDLDPKKAETVRSLKRRVQIAVNRVWAFGTTTGWSRAMFATVRPAALTRLR